MAQSYGIHWFRRDLRVAGNPALQWNWKRHNGRVVGIFSFDQKFLARTDYSKYRFAFFLETLASLSDELKKLGSELLFLDVGPEDSFRKILEGLKEAGRALPSSWTFNRDYEPFAVARDARLHRMLQEEYGIEVRTERDHLLIEPKEIAKDQNKGVTLPYQIYTPFSKKWLNLFETEEIQDRVQAQKAGLSYLRKLKSDNATDAPFSLNWSEILGKDASPYLASVELLNSYRAKLGKNLEISLPPAGSLAALEQLSHFKGARIQHYGSARDIPALPGTSQISIYLKNGSLTSSQVIAELKLNSLRDEGKETQSGAFKYLKEIIWREFYYHILAHFPRVESECFLKPYASIAWENRSDYFQAWMDGLTGFPIVDAGMRQLRVTGWMHNRVRMIVASFLTKDLLIDYRWGENHFMKYLLDGDLAPNNGGWQWAASTGCDPQPYFRIFNPWLQSKKFDPEGDYLRRWIPELKNLSADEIHSPGLLAQSCGYPLPIVDHSVQSKKAIALFKAVRQS